MKLAGAGASFTSKFPLRFPRDLRMASMSCKSGGKAVERRQHMLSSRADCRIACWPSSARLLLAESFQAVQVCIWLACCGCTTQAVQEPAQRHAADLASGHALPCSCCLCCDPAAEPLSCPSSTAFTQVKHGSICPARLCSICPGRALRRWYCLCSTAADPP